MKRFEGYDIPGKNFSETLLVDIIFTSFIMLGAIVGAFSRIAYEIDGWYYSSAAVNGSKVFIEGTRIEDFAVLMRHSLWMTSFAIIVILRRIYLNIRYFRSESKSIYLMKRLPQKNELLKRTMTIPGILAVYIAIIPFAIYVLMYYYYTLQIPSEAIVKVMNFDYWGAVL